MVTRKRALFLALGAALVALTTHSFAKPEADTVFAAIEQADARQHAAARSSRLLTAQVSAHDEKIARTLQDLDVTKRATEKLRRELIFRQIAWANSERLARRGLHGGAGSSRRLADLIDISTRRALEQRRPDHEMVAAIDHGEKRVRELVGLQGSLIVELAQHEASAEVAKEERSKTIADARHAKPGRIDRDLAKTDEALARQMGLMLKNPSEKDFHRLKGTLVPPVKAEPSHRYGPRKQRTGSSYVRHTGLTYSVAEGTEVRAVAAGLVVYAKRFEGFGVVMIIDHGVGYHSVYAHLSETLVKPGARVSRSTPIARSGESGSLEGPKLYFELRKGGRPINPTSWFIRF